MLRYLLVVLVVVSSMIGCSAERGSSNDAKAAHHAQVIEPARDPFAIGATVTPQGAIPRGAQTESFPRGGEVYLSIHVAGASSDQQISVQWVSPRGEVMRQDEAAVPQGTAYVAFSSGSTQGWRQGEHRAVITINGRRVSERQFDLL